jgi:hypothetical protein
MARSGAWVPLALLALCMLVPLCASDAQSAAESASQSAGVAADADSDALRRRAAQEAAQKLVADMQVRLCPVFRGPVSLLPRPLPSRPRRPRCM